MRSILSHPAFSIFCTDTPHLVRPSLTIDCAVILKATSDAGLVSELARQTGYWPVFGFLASANNMIDLAAVGLIGQKGNTHP